MSASAKPVVLRPILKERVWGKEQLPAWYPQPEPGKPVGEAWLTAVECASTAGPTLAELVEQDPAALQAVPNGFPLLIKMLFPQEKLSVQLHPNDAEAQALGQPRGKTECWYVVAAEPGATVAVGLQHPMSDAEVRQAITEGTLETAMRHLPVKAGDLVFVEAGTIHAIGPGVTVLETQQYSDITYRLFDYGRPRELHVEQGMAVLKSGHASGLTQPVAMQGFTRLVSSPYFVVDKFVLAGPAALGSVGAMQIVVALSEGCALMGAGEELALPAGWAVVLPKAEMDWQVSGAGELIRMTLPE